MTNEVADVVIVGAGIEGLSTAWHLGRRGVGRVVVVERDVVGSGGTGRSSSIVRCHYGVPVLATLAQKGLEFFEHALDIIGVDIGFNPVGYLVGVGEDNVEPLRAIVAMQQSLGIDARVGPPDEFAPLWPEASFEDFALMAYEPRGGIGDAYRTAMGFREASRSDGVELRQHTPVLGLVTSPDGSTITGVATADSVIEAHHVVLACGPWCTPLLEPIGIDVPVRSQRAQILMIHTGMGSVERPVLSDLALLQYIRAETTGELLVGNSDHAHPEWVDPDDYRNAADWDYVERAADKLSRRFPQLPDAEVARSYSGCYDVTPDYNPVISAMPIAGLFVATGFSGHGFKIAPAVGELMADLVTASQSLDPRVDEHLFRWSRFADEEPMVSTHRYAGAWQLR